ncbi:glutathione S-transferase family protein [Limnohabitans sp. Rim8]|uniref:glutathione S-transferase family protein n=1 Tax=Limnohabitans sp. Rim8 TaxID=1100718 RepID=UPI0033058744
MEATVYDTVPEYELVLYHAWSSSASRRVRFCLEEKGLAYQGHVIDLFKLEQHSDEYRKLNPNGMVPTLIHQNRAVIESTVINEYLDAVFPAHSLRPAEPFARAQMRVWTKHADEVVIRAFQVASWNWVMGPIATDWSDKELEQNLARIPTPNRREDWRRMARQPFTDGEIEFAVAQIKRTLEMMEDSLRHSPWLAGETFSFADTNMAPYLVRMNEHARYGLFLKDYSRVEDWWVRVQARPAFGRAKIEPALQSSS